MSNLKQIVGKNLKRRRKERKLTQTQLSVIANVQYRTVGYIEQGRYLGRVDTLEKLIKALDIPAGELFTEIGTSANDSSALKIKKMNQVLSTCSAETLDTIYKVILALSKSL